MGPTTGVVESSHGIADLVALASRLHVPAGWADAALVRAEMVVPRAPAVLDQALHDASMSVTVTALPGGHEAVRRWLVLNVAARLDSAAGRRAVHATEG